MPYVPYHNCGRSYSLRSATAHKNTPRRITSSTPYTETDSDSFTAHPPYSTSHESQLHEVPADRSVLQSARPGAGPAATAGVPLAKSGVGYGLPRYSIRRTPKGSAHHAFALPPAPKGPASPTASASSHQEVPQISPKPGHSVGRLSACVMSADHCHGRGEKHDTPNITEASVAGGRSIQQQERRKRQRQRYRQRKRLDLKNRVCQAAGLNADDEDTDITIIKCKRNIQLRNEMKGQQYAHDDKIFHDGRYKWRRIGGMGRRTGRIFLVDSDSGELIFACRITEHEHMTPEDTSTFQYIFSYLHRDRQYHRKCAINGAHVRGNMVAVGWRKAMVTDEAYATYAANDTETDGFYQHACVEGPNLHAVYSARFKTLAPALQRHQIQQHRQLRVPALGHGKEQTSAEEEVFCSNLAYTRDNFENKGHCDEDESVYTFGIGGNVFSKDSKMATFADGYGQTGGFFYIADYGFIIDYSRIDGVVEQIWQGPKHVHSTVGGSITRNYTRIGSSCQINKRLARAVVSHLGEKKDVRKFVYDDYGRFVLARKICK